MKKILAIGCGGAGMFSLIVASQLKKNKFKTTVFSDEADIYCRCSTPYILTGETTVKASVQPESMFTEYGFDIVHEKAISIDVRKKQVTTDVGKAYDYDYLVISTGASPVKLPIPGSDLAGVYTVRTSSDAAGIQAGAKKAQSAVVIGAGVIGMEMAGALRSKGLDVHLVEYAHNISSGLSDQEFAKKIVDNLTTNGIKVLFESEVVEIKETKAKRKKVQINHNGKRVVVEADLVIMATGIKPNLEVIAGTGIKANKFGILVDKKMRTNIKNIYACGDCCVPLSAVTGESKPSSLASSAIQQAKVVGYQMAGYPIAYAGSTGAFAFKILGKDYASVGLTEEEARKKYKFVAIGRASSTDLYRDLKKVQPLEVKLIFAGLTMRLVGYEAFGSGVIPSAEVASFAIGLKLHILKLLKFNYIAHPSLTPWPFMNPIVMAAEDAMGSIMKKIKIFS
ncbi:FAD-dependent oxidoreductase [Candidatus Parcubacteria bacterium]|nr:FAD-dependent oxidoreductase [Patescibacteria group bacterium]MBU4309421.1 FAD-dependent oxidoreductase [Patescibacteria group bacterium]MBU4431980.1 FAD-dependent oxidoreductase [Patescibacteria group bacterium]MBU4577782.1 FAD-dependent oxidoreductase [Patescibacteria group bacterium]MCG2697467.1 FAD-dependent oxidoreductase [Candidatus Parcubacteria bacterium]